MLIKNYYPSTEKTLNYKSVPKYEKDAYDQKFRNLKYKTRPIPNVFENLDPLTLNNLIWEQQKAVKEEAKIFLKYNFLTQTTYEKTLEQYKNFFFYEDYAYPIQLLKDFTVKDHNRDQTFLEHPELNEPPQPKWNPHLIEPQKQILKISRQAIRNITGYTPSPIPLWSYKSPYNTPEFQKPTFIKWQSDLLEDQADVIVVNWSRQIWKSHTIAERAIEESFIPENDTLVWAFLVKTTNVIRNYILKLTRKFPEGTFVHYKSEGYIINTRSNTRVYFRTLADDAQNVLGLTLHNIIIDEAQLVDEDVFENALLPTLTTTWWRLILIWTPGKKQKGYYFKRMIEAKKQKEDPTINPYEKISLYEVTIEKNPLVHPRTRKRIMAKKHEPAIQRQYFCSWNSWVDNLFQPKYINSIHDLLDPNNKKHYNLGWYLVLWIDPARLADRSGYALNYVLNWKVTTIISWEVPMQYKKKWELQASFYKKMIEKIQAQINPHKNKKQEKHFMTVMDVTWVWDWVAELFDTYWVKINVKIRYWTWFNPSYEGIDWQIPKPTLINNALDFISEEVYEVLEPTNKLFKEELEYIYEDQLRNGQIAMTSTYFDDICLSWDTLVTTLFGEKKIKNIKIWEKVLTPFWFRKVTASWQTWIKETIKINLKWKTLTGTPDHKLPIRWKNNWQLNQVQYNNDIYLLSFKDLLLWKLKKSFILNEKNIDWCEQKSIIYLNMKTIKIGKVLKLYIEKYGKTNIEKFLMVLLFIIKIIIHLIIVLITLNYLKGLNIINIIWKKILKTQNIKKQELDHSEIIKKNVMHGIQQKSEKNGIKNTIKIAFEKLNQQNWNALSVEQYFIQREKQKNNVQINVGKEQKQRHINMNVIYAEKNLKHNIKKQNVVQKNANKNVIINKEKEPVYNITVENVHCFYANGILVYNCNSSLISLTVIKFRNLMSRATTIAPKTETNTADQWIAEEEEMMGKKPVARPQSNIW